MKYLPYISLLIGFNMSGLGLTQKAQASQRMPVGSFLKHPAHTVLDLRSSAERDHQVSKRYARLFHLANGLVPAAFDQLHKKSLSEDHIYDVYFIKSDQSIIYKKRLVKKGISVWCMPDGQPLLLEICGNPIRKTITFTPGFRPLDSANTLVPPRKDVLALPPPKSVRVFHPEEALLTAPISPAVNVLAPLDLPVDLPLPVPLMRSVALPPIYSWLKGGPDSWWAAGAPLLTIPFIHSGGSSIPSGGSGDLPSPPPVAPPVSVPESSLVAMVIAAFVSVLPSIITVVKTRRTCCNVKFTH